MFKKLSTIPHSHEMRVKDTTVALEKMRQFVVDSGATTFVGLVAHPGEEGGFRSFAVGNSKIVMQLLLSTPDVLALFLKELAAGKGAEAEAEDPANG